MENDDSRREENYKEFLHLTHNQDYYDVTFDEQSGGVSAIHKEHCFDKQIGAFGYKRGNYELSVSSILRSNGYSVTLESEYPKGKGIKAFDALINGIKTEIKTVESNGRWSVRTKIQSAIRQGAKQLVLYYPSEDSYSEAKINEGWNYALQIQETNTLTQIITIVGTTLKILKPPG